MASSLSSGKGKKTVITSSAKATSVLSSGGFTDQSRAKGPRSRRLQCRHCYYRKLSPSTFSRFDDPGLSRKTTRIHAIKAPHTSAATGGRPPSHGCRAASCPMSCSPDRQHRIDSSSGDRNRTLRNRGQCDGFSPISPHGMRGSRFTAWGTRVGESERAGADLAGRTVKGKSRENSLSTGSQRRIAAWHPVAS
jgi:hypothetical protein